MYGLLTDGGRAKENAMADAMILLASIFQWWQPLALLVVIALIVFWVMYRRKQM